jgi:cysteine synthase A
VLEFGKSGEAMMTATATVDRPWSMDTEYSIDVAGVTGRFPALESFRRGLGRTPLLDVPVPAGSARVLAKAEWENPCGSIKDRTAFALLCEFLAHRADPADLPLIEYSGGNLANPLSVLAEQLGIDLTLVLSDATPHDYVHRLRDHGAKVELVDRHAGFLGVMEHARDMAATPGTPRHLLYQHRSQANVWMHRTSTGAEIVDQLAGEFGGLVPDRFVASIGTGGTLAGVLAALKTRHAAVRGVAVTPSELPYGSAVAPNGKPKYAGSGGLGDGIRQPFVREVEADIAEYHTVSRDDALAGMAEYLDRTGIRIGSSAAANWRVALDVAARIGPDGLVVTVFPDAGSPSEWADLGR